MSGRWLTSDDGDKLREVDDALSWVAYNKFWLCLTSDDGNKLEEVNDALGWVTDDKDQDDGDENCGNDDVPEESFLSG
jgi:hypothetical protein